MATKHVKLVKTTNDCTADEIKYTCEYRVKITSGGIIAARTAVDPTTGLTLPNYLDAYAAHGETNVYARCTSLKGEQLVSEDRSGYRWVAEFSTKGKPPNEPTDPDEPWTKRPEWSFLEVDYTLAAEEGRKTPGGALESIVNVNGQPYDPGLEIVYTNTLIRVRFWLETIDLSAFDTYRNAVNSDVFWGYAARRLRVNSIEGKEVFEYNKYFAELAVEIEVNNNPRTSGIWKRRVQEAGAKVKRIAGATELSLPMFDEIETTDVVLLAPDGTQLPPTGTPVYTDWYVDDEVAFGDMGLPAFPAHIVKT